MENTETKSTSKKIDTKTMFYIGGGLLGVVLIYQLFSSAKSVFQGDQNIDDTVPVGNLPGNNATISAQQAAIFAQQLLDAMNAKEPFWGTDEPAILAVFRKLKNGDDFRLIYNAFGNKDYNGYNSPPVGVWSNLDSYEKRNLVYWLKSEISPSDGQVYDLVKKYVELAGFAF